MCLGIPGKISEVLEDGLLRQGALEELMHAVDRIADRHGVEGVAVISRANGSKLMFILITQGMVVLERHFHGYFHRHRTGITEEYFLQAGRRQIHQSPPQFHRGFMTKSAEHHMAQ